MFFLTVRKPRAHGRSLGQSNWLSKWQGNNAQENENMKMNTGRFLVGEVLFFLTYWEAILPHMSGVASAFQGFKSSAALH